MFTGIVEETGTVENIEPKANSIQLTISSDVCGKGTKLGDSIAVNGCCLTVVEIKNRSKRRLLRFDLLRETWNLTSFQNSEIGDLVNLERSLRPDSRMGGHFVTGHIDGIGTIKTWEKRGKDWLLEIVPPTQVMKYVIHKGAIAIDGISLTVARVLKKSFQIWIIPHTYEVTALRERTVGSNVNLEADLLGKYVEQFVRRVNKRR